ncbi:sulfurtransferase [Olivibacter sp. SDN3]|uniref:sulfurtransferase n=1 Tax=Olivibacter sp. SDN3 TaxID=2764720 RepID=UPI0016511ABA|nr:sulfurtransferase [Olivibacter sp. SDN3]QNL48164.1 sulfurtransferase [Olivibacter sp. SDN3]
MRYSPIIDATELLSLLDSDQLVIIDASNGPEAKTNYLQSHVKGARLVDLDTQLSNVPVDPANGGRHPLPAVKTFTQTLGNLGITAGSHVVIYDDKNGSNAAARFWWMLRAIGHSKVQVLDGGLAAAKRHELPLRSGEERVKAVEPYPAEKWLLPISTLEEVQRVSRHASNKIIDVRSNARYRGIEEPIDAVAGHIPNAVNIPLSNNLDEQGYFKDAAELKQMYIASLGDELASDSIIHCGSGVTACHTLLAFDYAGLDIPKLYVGSWSEWSSNNLPVARDGSFKP